MTLALDARPGALATAAGPAESPRGGSRTFGLISIGQTQLGLPLDTLREVVPSPAHFDGLPVAAKGLVGALALRGQVVPVLDLRLVLEQQAPRGSEQVVVLLRHAGCVLGLLADRVGGLVECAPGSLQAIGLDCGDALGGADPRVPGLLFKGSFERADAGGVVSVLDVAALMRLPGVPLLRAEPPRPSGAGRVAAAAEQRSLMLVRCGDLGLAIDAGGVHATLPRLSLQASALQSAVCRGIVEHAGLRIPAADPLALLELGELPRDEPCEALLLRFEQGFVALLVSRVVDIVRVPTTDLLPLSPLAVRRADLLQSTLALASHGDYLVPVPTALQQHPQLLTLASMNVRTGSPRTAAAALAAADAEGLRERRGVSVITYDIAGEAATRLGQIGEVLPLQSAVMRLASAHPALIGLLSHRGRTVTLCCLATLLGRVPMVDSPERCVLMVELPGASVGFVVSRLCGIDTTVWEQTGAPDGAAPGRPRSARVLGPHPMVELGASAKRRTVPLIDLHAQVLELTASARARASLPGLR